MSLSQTIKSKVIERVTALKQTASEYNPIQSTFYEVSCLLHKRQNFHWNIFVNTNLKKNTHTLQTAINTSRDLSNQYFQSPSAHSLKWVRYERLKAFETKKQQRQVNIIVATPYKALSMTWTVYLTKDRIFEFIEIVFLTQIKKINSHTYGNT